MSLRVVSLSPPSWYSKMSVSYLRPAHLRNEVLSMLSSSTRKYPTAWGSLRAEPAMVFSGSRHGRRTELEREAAYQFFRLAARAQNRKLNIQARSSRCDGSGRRFFLVGVGLLACPLVNAHHDELRRLHRRHADLDHQLPRIAALGRVRLLVALHVERVLARTADERALRPEVVEEILHRADDLLPERFFV